MFKTHVDCHRDEYVLAFQDVGENNVTLSTSNRGGPIRVTGKCTYALYFSSGFLQKRFWQPSNSEYPASKLNKNNNNNDTDRIRAGF